MAINPGKAGFTAAQWGDYVDEMKPKTPATRRASTADFSALGQDARAAGFKGGASELLAKVSGLGPYEWPTQAQVGEAWAALANGIKP